MKTISKTQSLCPVCQKPIQAFYVEKNDHVYLTKTCSEHGYFEALIAQSKNDFIEWTNNPAINIPPKKAITSGIDGECPLHCGTCDKHLQTACCVLLDVTTRCNQQCPYCFARSGVNDGEDVPLAKIKEQYQLLKDLGEERPFNIQLSGGEPTVRDDLPEIIKLGKEMGFDFIQINTNGKRLALEVDYAMKLKAAGASVVFMQFDGTNNDIYKALRNDNLLELKKQAVANCRKAGLPVTLVPTIVRSVNLSNIGEIIAYMLANLDVVKGIHFQPVSFFGRHPDGSIKEDDYENRVTLFDIMHEIEAQTDGKLHYSDMAPISTGHPLCCFCSTFLKEQDGNLKSMASDEEKRVGVSCCNTTDPLEVIKKSRDFVLNKWVLPDANDEGSDDSFSCCQGSVPSESKGCSCNQDISLSLDDPMDLDTFIRYMKSNMFTISCMAFQDLSNLDAERLKRCRVQVLTDDNRLVPFCGYNTIYR